MADPGFGALVGSLSAHLARRGTDWLGERLSEEFSSRLDSSQAEQRVQQLRRVKTLLQKGEAIDLLDVYWVPTVSGFAHGVHFEKRLTNIVDCLNTGQSFLATGLAGHGKSLLLRYLAIQTIACDDRVPILVELRFISSGRDIYDLIGAELEQLGCAVERTELSTFLRSTGILLLLDGFDEADRNLRGHLLRQIEQLDLAPNIQIFATSRPESAIQSLPCLTNLQLRRLTAAEVPSVVSRICVDADEEVGERVIRTLSSSDARVILNDIVTPIMAALLVGRFRHEDTLPQTLADFYRELFPQLMVRHDSRKGYVRGRVTNLGITDLERTLHYAAFKLRQCGDANVFARTLVVDVFNDAARKLCGKAIGEDVLVDISECSNILLREGEHYEFIHKTILEFFCCQYIASRPERARARFYEQIRSNEQDQKWTQELDFLETEDPYGYTKFYAVPAAEELLGLVQTAIRTCDIEEIDVVFHVLFEQTTESHVEISFGIGMSSFELLCARNPLHDIAEGWTDSLDAELDEAIPEEAKERLDRTDPFASSLMEDSEEDSRGLAERLPRLVPALVKCLGRLEEQTSLFLGLAKKRIDAFEEDSAMSLE